MILQWRSNVKYFLEAIAVNERRVIEIYLKFARFFSITVRRIYY